MEQPRVVNGVVIKPGAGDQLAPEPDMGLAPPAQAAPVTELAPGAAAVPNTAAAGQSMPGATVDTVTGRNGRPLAVGDRRRDRGEYQAAWGKNPAEQLPTQPPLQTGDPTTLQDAAMMAGQGRVVDPNAADQAAYMAEWFRGEAPAPTTTAAPAGDAKAPTMVPGAAAVTQPDRQIATNPNGNSKATAR